MIGVLFFIVTLLALVLVHEFGHFGAARWFGVAVEEFGFGFPPAIAKKRWGKTTYSFNWLPLGGFVRIKGEENAVAEPDSFSVQSSWRRAVIIVAGVVMNLLVVVILFTVGFSVGLPQELDQPLPSAARVRDVRHQVAAVMPDSPASSALVPGDVIVAIDGQTFNALSELQAYIRGHSDSILNLTVERGGTQNTVSLQPTRLRLDDGEIYGLGVSLFTTGVVAYPFYRAPLEAVRLTGKLFGLIAKTLGELVVGLLRGAPTAVDVTGPIGIAILTTEVVHLGWIFFLQFVAILSLNLAFINLLPFPALDGGRLLFILIEIIRRRPVSEATEGRIHRWGFTFLILLVLVVTYFDLNRFGGVFGGWLEGLKRFVF
jgi:regulator of sigma E protease